MLTYVKIKGNKGKWKEMKENRTFEMGDELYNVT